MTKLKSILVVLCLAISSSLAFAQHEDLILKYHEKNNDFTMKALFKNVGVIDNNTSAEELLEVIAEFYQEKDIVAQLDQKRHEYLVEGVSNARANRRAKTAGFLNQLGSLLVQIPALEEQHQREVAAQEAERQEQLRIKNLEKQEAWQQEEARRQEYLDAEHAKIDELTAKKREQSQVVRNQYTNTSDLTMRRAYEMMNRQSGEEATQQKIQEMRNQEIQERAQAARQSSVYQQQAAQNQAAQVRNAERYIANNSYGSTAETENGTVTSAITKGRTQIYILVEGGIVRGYARGKDSMGRFNWTYGNTMITDIKYTPYYEQFKREYSKAADIPGIGYVFFN